ncbi:quinone-dependent dihydroorotate dehydrogenase [Sphingobium sufflavum]|uniref:quinone-dependent dihydroorotate dehydrogenase n=1 Tax=Sphingobium sufflavum TaxID=1129547 RepID=UPI001F3C95F4|nr:quinone-dependent dihydroorotate dehydrogenase [Sphingobium sufflavum]MCE7795163.1 quinone-dependent dihydroorotate dehydrogenase [Sphingobium sufflavum]
MIFRSIRPLLFRLDAESAHRLTIRLLRLLPASASAGCDPILRQSLFGLDFAGPVGLAPGFDKDAEVYDRMGRFGFAFSEVGTLTPRPQAGNPRPRLFRLVEDEAVINRMGFNNGGQADAYARLARRSGKAKAGDLVVGVNIGANKDSEDRIVDYVAGIAALGRHADYITVNISSPNTPGLRALQDRGALDSLLAAVMAARGESGPPVWLKVAPDLEPADVTDIAEVALAHRIDALIVSNTTISRPATLRSPLAGETGGLSGAPLHDLALERLRDFRRATGGRLPLIGVGGIGNAEQAYARIRAGASLVQLYSALVYEGPMLARTINEGLVALLRRDGFASVADAVGVDCPLA